MSKSLRPSLFLVVSLLVLVAAHGAEARGIPVFYSSGSEKIVKVADFPDTDEFRMESGEYIDAGYMFKQVQIFWIPLWNYGGTWCGYVGKEDAYLELPKSELDAMASAAKVTLPGKPSLGFWNAYFGKILILLVVLGAGAIFLLPDAKATPGEATTEA